MNGMLPQHRYNFLDANVMPAQRFSHRQVPG